MFKRSKSNANGGSSGGSGGSTKKLNFTVTIHELILPVFPPPSSSRGDDGDASWNNNDDDKTTNALRAIAWYRGNRKSGVTRSIVAKPHGGGGEGHHRENRIEDAPNSSPSPSPSPLWERHDFGDESFAFEATMTENQNKKKSLRFLILEANKNEAEAPKEGVKKVAGMHVGTVDCDLCDFTRPERRGGRMGQKVTVEVELEQKFLEGKGKNVLKYSSMPRVSGRARMTMTIRHDGEDPTKGSSFAAAEDGSAQSMGPGNKNNRFLRINQEQQEASTSSDNNVNSNNNNTYNSNGSGGGGSQDRDTRPISTFSVADVVKPGQRPVGNVATNRMPLAKPSSSLHASRFGAGGAAGVVVNAARPAMSSENDTIMMDASKSTAKMFARNRFENVPSTASEQPQANEVDDDDDHDGEWNPFSTKHDNQKNQQQKEEKEATEEDWNPFAARRGNGGSPSNNLGTTISAADRSETPRMGDSNARDNNAYKNDALDDKEVDSDGFLLDSDLETEDDEFVSDEDDDEKQEDDEDDIDDALTHRTSHNDETYVDDDDRCTTPPLTPGPTRPPPTPPHRKSSYAGSSVDHRSELRDREDFATHGTPNPAGGPMFVDKSPEFRRRSLKFRTDKQLFADDVLESKGSPPFRNARTNSLLVDVSLESNGDDLRRRSFNNSMDRSRGDFDWSSIPMPQAAAESLLLQTQRHNSNNNAASSHTARSDAPSSPTKNSELSMVERISQDWDLEYRAGIRASSEGNRSEGVRSSLLNVGSQPTNRTSTDTKGAVQQLEQELEMVKTRYEHEISELKDDLSEEQQKNQRISEQLERTKKNLDETKLELGATQVSHARLEDENEQLKNLAQTPKQNMAAARSQQQSNESAEIAAAQNSLKVASSERDEARNEIEQLRQVIETLRMDLTNEKARTSLEFAMRKSSLGDDQSDVIMREAGHAYSSTSGNDSDGDMIPPWAKRSTTVVTKFDRLKSTRAIVDEDSSDEEETDDDEEVNDDNDPVIPQDEQGGVLHHQHQATTTTIKEHSALIEAALVRTPQTTENFVVAKTLFAYAFQDDEEDEASREERCYRVLDAFSGCIRGYAFDEPKQLVAIWVQIAAFARGLKSKGNNFAAAWEDARKLRDETFTFAFEAVWRRAMYPCIMCTSDDECAAESVEKRNELKGDGERVGRVYVRALDRAAILLGVNETANQAPGLAVANAAILRAILSRLDNALVRTILSLEEASNNTFDLIKDVANLVPGKGVVSFSAGAHLKQCVSLVSRWSDSIGGMSTSNGATPFVALSVSRSLADAMMVPRVNLMDETVRSGIQGQLTNVMIGKILEKRVKCELDDDRVDPNTAAAIAECVIRLSEEDDKSKTTTTAVNASAFLDFNADKIGADQVWDERQFLLRESRDALERAKASSFPRFAERWFLR